MDITAKDAVTKALIACKDFYPAASELRLEQIEPNEKSGGWNVVISFFLPSDVHETAASAIAKMIQPDKVRLYKDFHVKNGEVEAMRAWKP